jgi:hypothetical protein
MTDAETILKLIETVDPSDTAKMDEIDLRTAFFLEDKEFHEWKGIGAVFDLKMRTLPSYTRSRDALKAIRPKGYILVGNCQNNPDEFRCEFLLNHKIPTIYAYGPTEELAELHAIIQAIAYQRSL